MIYNNYIKSEKNHTIQFFIYTIFLYSIYDNFHGHKSKKTARSGNSLYNQRECNSIECYVFQLCWNPSWLVII